MKVLLAYGSAMARIDAMKLFGGVSGGTTGAEILDAMSEMNVRKDLFAIRALTNSWVLSEGNGYRSVQWDDTGRVVTHEGVPRFTFRTWEDYRDLLYNQCERWEPDIVICAVAVSNYTPRYVVQEGKNPTSDLEMVGVPCVKGKIDSRVAHELLIKFRKTPNIIGGVRERIGRNAVLVGFKLTSHGDVDELLKHAEQVLYESRCDVVVANDLELGLGRKWFVTATGSWEGTANDIPEVALGIANDKKSGFYHSNYIVTPPGIDISGPRVLANKLFEALEPHWTEGQDTVDGTVLHGCFALRLSADNSFITTRRGKQKGSGNDPLTVVDQVDHTDLRVHHAWNPKATLNAPLLHRMLYRHPDVFTIVHLHRMLRRPDETVRYRVPGTVSEVDLADRGVKKFNIEGHGSILCFDHVDVDHISKFINNPETWA